MQAHGHVDERGDCAKTLADVIGLEHSRVFSDHQTLLRCRSWLTHTLRIIARTIAMPRKMAAWLACTPSRISPVLRRDTTKAPIRAPIAVPDPPKSEVPPMTAAAMDCKVTVLFSAGTTEDDTSAVMMP